MSAESILLAIKCELEKCKTKHPEFPLDVIERIAIMAEEAGEAVQAANNIKWENGNKDDLKLELLQTAAVCVRILEAMEDEE